MYNNFNLRPDMNADYLISIVFKLSDIKNVCCIFISCRAYILDFCPRFVGHNLFAQTVLYVCRSYFGGLCFKSIANSKFKESNGQL